MKILLRQTISYGFIGMLSAGLDAFIFTGLFTWLQWDPYIANAISIHCGILCSFALNRKITFRATDKTGKRFLMFYGTGLFGLLLSQGILWLGPRFCESVLLVKLASIFLVAAVQFLLNRTFAFGQPHK